MEAGRSRVLAISVELSWQKYRSTRGGRRVSSSFCRFSRTISSSSAWIAFWAAGFAAALFWGRVSSIWPVCLLNVLRRRCSVMHRFMVTFISHRALCSLVCRLAGPFRALIDTSWRTSSTSEAPKPIPAAILLSRGCWARNVSTRADSDERWPAVMSARSAFV